jgi:hypothetical protein
MACSLSRDGLMDVRLSAVDIAIILSSIACNFDFLHFSAYRRIG